jgi:hypothetical protein
VPDVTNITAVALTDFNPAAHVGAACLRPVGLPGTSVPASGLGTGPSTAVAHAVPRVRGTVASAVPQAKQDAVAALLGQANSDNYMTGVLATGEGAAGPPRETRPV